MKKSSRRIFIKSAAINGMLASFINSVFAFDNSERKPEKSIVQIDEKDNYLQNNNQDHVE